MTNTVSRDLFFAAVKRQFGNINTVSRKQIIDVCESNSLTWPAWFINDAANRSGRGLYNIDLGGAPVAEKVVAPAAPVQKIEASAASAEMALVAVSNTMTMAHNDITLVPEKARGYVPFGNFADVRQIVKSNKYYPMYITGLSGNGKTMMIEQVCAQEKREMVRVNITIETDEDDLLGGFRLVDGRTVWQNGPVIVAMERGAILLLDEVDLGSNKMMCLQPVLEGKSIYLKKINKVITPAAGFNIIATANTKGKGSDDGRFIGTNVMNEAFLERFSITMEQEYPASKVEEKILTNVLASSGVIDGDFVKKLVAWADVIRKSFYEGAVSEIISTRRLVHICDAFVIFNLNREKAITLCLNRFDIDTKTSFLDLYKKLDETIEPVKAEVEGVVSDTAEVAF